MQQCKNRQSVAATNSQSDGNLMDQDANVDAGPYSKSLIIEGKNYQFLSDIRLVGATCCNSISIVIFTR